MCRLGGEFAGILRVSIPSDQATALESSLSALATQGLKVVTQPDSEEIPSISCQSASIEIVGQDRPGIVRHISVALAKHQVNVEEFRSECSSAPMSGETLFSAQLCLQIPPACNVPELRRELEKIAADLMVDITFADLEPTPSGGSARAKKSGGANQ
jgi:glycine cleavage system regulatory protein